MASSDLLAHFVIVEHASDVVLPAMEVNDEADALRRRCEPRGHKYPDRAIRVMAGAIVGLAFVLVAVCTACIRIRRLGKALENRTAGRTLGPLGIIRAKHCRHSHDRGA